MEKNSKILITGGNGLVGSAIKRVLEAEGYSQIYTPSSAEFNLCDFNETKEMFEQIKPEYVFHNAARVYGIMGNMKNKALSYLDNVLINTHVVEMSHKVGVKKIVAMGSGCVYPYPSPGLPLTTDMIWMGYPHFSEDSYAISKRAMLTQLNAYKDSYGMEYAFVISANLYGPNDKFDEELGHVTPALISKFYKAYGTGSDVIVWGDGSAQRDFLFADDVGYALLNIMLKVNGPVNMGSGSVSKIGDIVEALADITGLHEKIKWDASKPNGQDYRGYDLTQLFSTGFVPKYDLRNGLEKTWKWYLENQAEARR